MVRRSNDRSEVDLRDTKLLDLRSRGETLQPQSPGQYPRDAGFQTHRYPRPNSYDPFRCSYCNSPRTLTAFANVYATSSSLSKYRKGLIIKSGWAETKKQSVLAMRCAPPKKHPLWWPILLVVLGLATSRILGSVPLLSSYAVLIDGIGEVLMGIGGIAAAVAFIWNRLYQPKKMEIWNNSYYCKRCSRVTILTPKDE